MYDNHVSHEIPSWMEGASGIRIVLSSKEHCSVITLHKLEMTRIVILLKNNNGTRKSTNISYYNNYLKFN